MLIKKATSLLVFSMKIAAMIMFGSAVLNLVTVVGRAAGYIPPTLATTVMTYAVYTFTVCALLQLGYGVWLLINDFRW